MSLNNTNFDIQDLDKIYYIDFFSYINEHFEQMTKLKNQYIDLLSELTICEDMNNNLFYEKLQKINSMGLIIIAYKYESINSCQIEIVGSGTIIIEPKIIRGGKSVGHIEDIVVKKTYRGKKISQTILNELKEYAQKCNCYKVILDCDESVCPVYKSNGFEIKGIQMGKYL